MENNPQVNTGDVENQEVDFSVDTALNAAFASAYRTAALFSRKDKFVFRDPNQNTSNVIQQKYSREDIQRYLKDPQQYQRELRGVINYMYIVSPHFRRFIQYFVGLTDWAYIVAPISVDLTPAKQKALARNYRKVLDILSSFNIHTQFPEILTVCLREDTYFGTMWVTGDKITLQQLPSDACVISSIENNVANVTFDFSYFDQRKELLEFYPKEFKEKYEKYRGNKKVKWIELDSPTSFAVKCNRDVWGYSIPPFIGILREIYDLDDYKQLKLTRTALENYAMLVMTLPSEKETSKQVYAKARTFFDNMVKVLPDDVGAVLSPMKIEKIGFERANAGENNTIKDAESNLFTAAGVSSLLFNGDKSSANSLLLSIKVDQEITYGIVKSIEDVLNRFLQASNYSKNFRVNFLNVSAFNRKEAGDQYIKAAQYGLPTIMMYVVSQGLKQSEFDTMNFLENDVLRLKEKLIPLHSSAQESKSDNNDPEQRDAGRPTKDDAELTDSGEQNREDGDDW